MIESWDSGEAMDYIEEWGDLEAVRRRIDDVALLGVLTDDQSLRLDRLHQLVAEHRPILDRLRRGS